MPPEHERSSAGLPESYAARVPEGNELGAVYALVLACDLAEYGEPDLEKEELHADWENPDTDRWVVVSPEGKTVGYGSVSRPALENPTRFDAEGYVHPDHVGRGVGRYLLRRAEGGSGRFSRKHRERLQRRGPRSPKERGLLPSPPLPPHGNRSTRGPTGAGASGGANCRSLRIGARGACRVRSGGGGVRGSLGTLGGDARGMARTQGAQVIEAGMVVCGQGGRRGGRRRILLQVVRGRGRDRVARGEANLAPPRPRSYPVALGVQRVT